MALSLPPPPNLQSVTDGEDDKGKKLSLRTNWTWQSWFTLLQQKLNELIPPGGAQAAILFQEEGSDLGSSGTVTGFNVVGANITATRVGDTVTITENAQAPLQFRDEGSNLGTAGTANILNVVGTDLIASRVGNTVTLTHTNPTITITGDVTGSGTPSIATTLATVNGNVGTFGSATQVSQITVNAKGLITAASNVTISGVAPGGAAGGDLSGTYPNPTVAKINGVALGSTVATSGNMLIADGSSWVSRSISGDLTISSTGVATITAGGSVFLDSEFTIQDNVDTTKQFQFQASGITTGTTRTYTTPNASGVLALIDFAQTWTAAQTFSNTVTVNVGASAGAGVVVTGSNSPLISVTETSATVTGRIVCDSVACYIGTSTNNDVFYRRNNLDLVQLLSTGIAVTGAIDSTAKITAAVGGAAASGVSVTGTNTPSVSVTSTGSTVTGKIACDDAACYIGTATAHDVFYRRNNVDIVQLTVNGIAVTGTIDSTGKITAAVGGAASSGILVTGTNSPSVTVTASGTVTGRIICDGAACYIGTATAHDVFYRRNNVDIVQLTSTGIVVTGNVSLNVAGNGIYIKEGTNATMGVATLVAGTVVVSTTKVTANSRIFLTVQSLGTVAVATPIAVTARTAGTSFTITSSSITDTSVVAWVILEPAA